MVINLKDFGDCFDREHNGKPCNNKKCVVSATREEYKELMKTVLEEGKKWDST